MLSVPLGLYFAMMIVRNPFVLGPDRDLSRLDVGNHHVAAHLPFVARWEKVILTATNKEGITLIIKDGLHHSDALAVNLISIVILLLLE